MRIRLWDLPAGTAPTVCAAAEDLTAALRSCLNSLATLLGSQETGTKWSVSTFIVLYSWTYRSESDVVRHVLDAVRSSYIVSSATSLTSDTWHWTAFAVNDCDVVKKTKNFGSAAFHTTCRVTESPFQGTATYSVSKSRVLASNINTNLIAARPFWMITQDFGVPVKVLCDLMILRRVFLSTCCLINYQNIVEQLIGCHFPGKQFFVLHIWEKKLTVRDLLRCG